MLLISGDIKPKSNYVSKKAQTSGAIHRYVPVSAVIISVTVSSLARPKSASFTDF